MIPSLVMGLYLGFANGMWQLAFMSIGSSVIALIMAKRQRGGGAGSATDFDVALRSRRSAITVNGTTVSRLKWITNKKIRLAVQQHLARQISIAGEQSALQKLLHRKSLDLETNLDGRLWLGVANQNPLWLSVADAPHLLIVGPTGCGKTQLLRQLIESALVSKFRIRDVAVIDFKGGAAWVGMAHLDKTWLLASDLELSECWQKIQGELERREHQLAQARVARFQDAALGELIIFVDELGAAVQSPMAAKTLVAVAARGRSLGVFLVATNQGISGVPRELLLNLRVRICLAGTDQVELVQLGGKARELVRPDNSIFSARMLKQGEPEVDFVFAPGFI